MPLNDNTIEIAFETPFSTLFDAPVAVADQDMVGCIGVVGMPSDWTHSSRIGARHGPEALRRATTRIVREYLPVSEETFFDALHGGVWRRNEEWWIADLGDATIDPASVENTTAAIAEMTEHVRSAGGVPLALGGDHYNSYPACLGYSRALSIYGHGRRRDLHPFPARRASE
ncbi:MAG: hypothetical protein GY701_30635, partial [Sulfitobacter sp.]|nr:hypothetical protein [Sulfitobacter sp.]